MARLCVHFLPNRFCRDCVIWGMRVDTLASGVSTTSSTEHPGHSLTKAAMASDFMTEIFSVASVKTMTPAFPFESAITSAAETLATDLGSVEMLVKSGTPSIGPGLTLECQPRTL